MESADVTKERFALGGFLVLMAVAFCLFAWLGRYEWFARDEWAFLAIPPRSGMRFYLFPHNQHWVTLPLLLYRCLWRVIGLNSYRPYQACLLLLHLSAAFLVRLILRRMAVRPWTSTLVASLLLFFGSGYRNIVHAFQITMVGSVVFGLAHLLLSNRDGGLSRYDVGGLVAGLLGLMCSAVAVPMVFAVSVAVLIRRGWRIATFHALPLGIVLLIWYLQIRSWGFRGVPLAPTTTGLRYAFYLVMNTLEAIGQFPMSGMALVLLLGGGALLLYRSSSRTQLRRQAAMPVGLLAGAAAFALLTGFGRGDLKAVQNESRYLYVIAALALPAIGLAVDQITRRVRMSIPVMVLIASIGVLGNIRAAEEYTHSQFGREMRWYKHLFLSLPTLPVAREVPRWARPEPLSALPVTIGWLLDGVSSGRIPEPHRVTADDVTQGTLRLSLQQGQQASEDEACKRLARGAALRVGLDVGQWISIDTGRSVVVVPVGRRLPPPPRFIVDAKRGGRLYAVREVEFGIVRGGKLSADRVCGSHEVMSAATYTPLETQPGNHAGPLPVGRIVGNDA